MAAPAPRIVPGLMIERGRPVVPGPSGPTLLRDVWGEPRDLLDLADALIAEFGRIYVVDLDGIDRNRPQLDYLQEMSRDGDLWVDAGVRSADQAIDILVAGAARAVLSSSALTSPDEVAKAWALSPEVVVEIDLSGEAEEGHLHRWDLTPEAAAGRVRSMGPQELVVRFPADRPQWDLVSRLAAGGPAWVAGSIEPQDTDLLASAHAAGGIFQYGRVTPREGTTTGSSDSARAG